jgi:hypothetical protein
VRSERQFCERLQYDLLFKWFLDLDITDPAFHPTTFTRNREGLLKHDIARQFFAAVLEEARRRRLLSEDHFTVSQHIRKRVEEIFGWTKTVARDDKLRYIGLARDRLWGEFTAISNNLVRMARIQRQRALTAS